ncbi:uncharacterized protein [Triticum aestivum]|uniref:uncharacterized protein n=1 Tax=Triticum aestivum TaxID=4565 RepID=UPI001D006B77|nr:uncharacterized protein LOC123096879 [Triticum aestivum]
MKPHTTNRGLQGDAFRKDRHRSAATARSEDQSFPWSRTTGSESRDDAFKKGTSFAPPVHPKIEQVFTPANTHRHRTPHHGYRVAHTAMATGQHQATGSAQEHRTAATRAAAPASKTLTPPHPRPAATPTKETSGKVPPFAPLGDPQRCDPIGRPALASIDPSCSPERETSSVLQHHEGDEVSPAAPCARRVRSGRTVRKTSSVLLHRARHEQWTAAGRGPALRWK